MSNNISITVAWVKKKILPILKKHSVKRAAIFGSVARGEAKEKSDIDLLIEYRGKDKSLFDLIDLKLDLEQILSRKVDIVTYNSIYWRIRDQILKEQVVIL
jgi:predicted nucleotidyltransferase